MSIHEQARAEAEKRWPATYGQAAWAQHVARVRAFVQGAEWAAHRERERGLADNTTEREPSDWAGLLRMVGLGAGLHEPLRTRVIETAVENLREPLAEYDRKIAEQVWDDACEVVGEEVGNVDQYDLASNVRLANPYRASLHPVPRSTTEATEPTGVQRYGAEGGRLLHSDDIP